MRGVTGSFFIIIPLLVVLSTKPGLQRLLVIAPTGDLIFGYNFGKKKDIFDAELSEDMNQAVLTAGFLAAIANFSKQLEAKGSSLTLRSEGLYFTLEKVGEVLYAIQSLNFTKNLEQKFHEFASKVQLPQISFGELNPAIAEPIKTQIHESFNALY
jgi:hypothetical protein